MLRSRPLLLVLSAFLLINCAVARASSVGGRLAIQPVSGNGVLIADADGSALRRALCYGPGACVEVFNPHWSPDGRMLGDDVACDPNACDPYLRLDYDDGSCLSCGQPIGGSDPTFSQDGDAFYEVADGTFGQYTLDDRRQRVLARNVTAGTVAKTGMLAVVRDGQIWVGRPGRLRAIADGAVPVWRPDGSALAFTRRGHIESYALATQHRRILAQGSSPSWSPDGRQIAYIAANHRVRELTLATRRSNAVKRLRGFAVSWGPSSREVPGACLAPPNATALQSSDDAAVYLTRRRNGAEILSGCDTQTGKLRVLFELPAPNPGDSTTVTESAADGPYAAFLIAVNDSHEGAFSVEVKVYDLQAGVLVSGLGGETTQTALVACDPGELGSVDDLVLNAAGDTAVHQTDVCGGSPSATVESIIASDSSGVHTITTANGSFGAQPTLADLALNGPLLSWTDNGSPQTAQLADPALVAVSHR